ncbi:hypothetical protein NIES2101_23410, partial [Calothrix sp. HK-06]
MSIQAKHFDTRLNKWIHIDGNQDNQESILQEKISNTLLERFLPGKEFSFGHMDEGTTEDQLKNHPDGHKLLLSSKSRLLYGSEECLDVINQLCPDSKDRGAYGSIFLGGCRTAIDTELNILIVDDTNGDNGGIIDNDQAYRLTGDCYGQMSDEIYRQLTGHQDGDKYRVIQHRFGWTPEDGDDDKHRFGKGTFRPANLDNLKYFSEEQPKIDVIIPISSFKGTDKDNPAGPSKPQIKPGLYTQKVWIGEKSQSELGKTAISQVVASFPKGLKDFTEIIEQEAQKLAEAQKDPRKLAQLYCEKYEKRKDFLEEEANNLKEEVNIEFDQGKQDNINKLRERLENDSFTYKIIKADLAGSGQLLETEKIKNELTKFVQNEWRDIAIGKKLTFERALVIPSKDLKNGEICIPKYKDGEEVLNFRSPFLNSNGMCVSSNKLVDDRLCPDGKILEGIIVVSDETSERMYKRISSEIEEVLPEAKSQGIKLDGIENYLNNKEYDKKEVPEKIKFTDKLNEYITTLNGAGYNIDLLPYESEQERQARDYDGDCIGFEKASKYPNLAEEAIERNKPENAYLPTVKEKKQSFYNEDGTQPSFEKIAKHMSDGISVGVINNHLTSIEALESEQEIIKLYGNKNQQLEHVSGVAKHYYKILKREDPEKEYTIVPQKYKEPMREFVKLANAAKSNNSQELALQAMAVNKEMYRELIADAAYQNQIAVDLFKSAKPPDMDAVRKNSRILHRQVNYIKDKKDTKVYDTETINPTGQSPVELLIAKTNQYFRKAQLDSREISQFKDLFDGVEFTNNQRLRATLAKKEFDTIFNAASNLSRRRETEKGPNVDLTLSNNTKLNVTNLLDAKHPDIWTAKTLKIKVELIDEEKISSSKPHKYEVLAQVDNAVDETGNDKYLRLGTISKEQEYSLIKETGIQFGQVYNVDNFDFKPALSEGQIKVMFNHAYDVARTFYESIPEEDKLSMAAATWAVSTTKFTQEKDEEGESIQPNIKKSSTFVFAAFDNEIIRRVDDLQFSQTKITNIDKNSPVFNQDKVEVRYNIDTNGKDVLEIKNQDGEYEYFGNLEAQTGRMPIGTIAEAKISYKDIYSANITTEIPGRNPVTFKVTELMKHDLGQQPFNGKEIKELQIKKLHRPADDYTINIKDGNKFIKIGTLDEHSIKEGIKEGWIPEKTGTTGVELKLKITQIATTANGYAIGETPEGNLLRINLHKDFTKANFKDNDFSSVYMKTYPTNNIYIASINDETLGLVGEHKEANLQGRKPTKPSTVQSLINNKLIELGTTTTTIPARIESNISVASVSLNQETIKYPEEWIKRNQLLKSDEKLLTEQESIANDIITKINSRETLIFQDKQQKQNGVFGITIDTNALEKTRDFLEQKGISYKEVPASKSKLETKKGMTVLIINESTVSEENIKSIFLTNGRTMKNSDIPSKLPIPKDQLIYFTNPEAEYGDEKKSAVGFVVPTKNADEVQSWMEGFRASASQLSLGETTIVMATSESVNKQLEDILYKELGKPLDVATIDGFNKYETANTKLKEVIANTTIKSQTLTNTLESEYHAALKQYANRPKNLKAEQKEILPLAPIAPYNEKNLKITSTSSTASIQGTQQPNILDTKVGIIVQQVNPKAETIGSSFNQSLAEKYPNVAKKFDEDKGKQKGVNFVRINDDLYVAQISSQISSDLASKQTDFNKLTSGLKEIAEFAEKNNLPVYIPQGLAVEGKGQERLKSWDNIKQIIGENIPDARIELPNQEAINDIKERNKLINAPPTENIIKLVGQAEELSLEDYDTAINYLSPNELKWILVNSGLGSESLPNLANQKERGLIYGIFENETTYNRLLETTASRIDNNILTQIQNITNQINKATTPDQEAKADNEKLILTSRYGERLYSLLEEKAKQQTQSITLPSQKEANNNTSIEIMGTISPNKVEEIRQHLENNYKQLLEADVSNYSPGRQVAWVGGKWELNNKTFSPGVQDEKLMELFKQVYPDGDIALVTYSPNPGQGINYHRDDAYAANEARSINIGNSEWGYQPAKTKMNEWRDEKANTPVDEFELASGTVTRFHCKNAHAALNTEVGRWSVNIWSIKDLEQSKEVREKYNSFLQSNQPPHAIVNSNQNLTIKASEWSPGGSIQVERQYPSLAAAELAQIIRIGNNIQQSAKSPNIPDAPKISGTPVTMTWNLTNPDKSINATTTIDAMRSQGRVHSTRSENYYKKYGIKEGDIALAEGKDGKQVAFRVGKQYKITKQIIDNPDYQRAWVNWEKHNVSELLTRQSEKIDNKQPLYGLFMEPLGDYVNGKIVPFSSVEINSSAKAGIGTVLDNATDLAKKLGNLTSNYEISINGNPEASFGKYGRETHDFKPEGAPYKSAEHAYEHQKQTNPASDPYKLMVEVLQAKLEQHPRITATITKLGGIEYLEKAKVTNQDDKQWEGFGKESKFIRALSEAYTNVIQKTQNSELPAITSTRENPRTEELPPKTMNPLAELAPLNERVAKNMPKDIAMAEIATQFIGKSAAPPETPSSTRNYTEAWDKIGLANTGKYSKNDIIMVSANGPWRGVTMPQIEQIFKQHYEPLLSKAIEAKATFVVGDASGGDQLIKKFLQDNKYKITDSGKGYLVANVNERVAET